MYGGTGLFCHSKALCMRLQIHDSTETVKDQIAVLSVTLDKSLVQPGNKKQVPQTKQEHVSQFSLCCYDKTLPKSNMGNKVFICLTLSDHNPDITQRSQSRNLKTQTEAETIGLLACTPIMFSCLLYASQDHLPRTTFPGVASPPVGWTLPHQSTV